MSQYKYINFLKKNESNDFDLLYQPGAITPYSGIYRCRACGTEDISKQGNPLPPQNHHQHTVGLGPIIWQLIVSH
jgi:hypothetical protein